MDFKPLQKRRILFLSIAIVLTILIVLFGVLYYITNKNRVIKQEYDTLEAIGKWKLMQINNWREDLISLLKANFSKNFFDQINAVSGNHSDEAITYLEDKFENIISTQHINYCILLDNNLEVLYSTKADHDISHLYTQTKEAFEKSEKSGEPVFSDFYLCETNEAHSEIVYTIKKTEGTYLYLIFGIDIKYYLLPLIQTWPLHSDTSETLLFKAEDGNIVFLNELRHIENSALSFTIPMTETDLPAVQIASGKQGIVIGDDYRGVKTIAYGSPINDTDWYILAKIDYDEAFANMYKQHAYIVLIILLLIVISPLIILYFITKNDYTTTIKMYNLERDKNKTNEFFKFIINNLPQRIFWKDTNFIYQGCNEQFAKDRGYTSEKEIVGMTDFDLFPYEQAEVFRDIDKKILFTLEPKKGYEDMGIEDGEEFWLYKNKIPIVNREKKVLGVLGTYEDITEQKKTQNEIYKQTKFLQTVYKNIDAVLFSFDKNGIISFIEGNLVNKLMPNHGNITGQKFTEVFSDKDIFSAYENSLSGEDQVIHETKFKDTYIDIFLHPSFNSKKEVTAVYGIAVDITQLHYAISELKRSNMDLEQFAYVASHDLQEPLRMVSNFTQLLEKKYADKLDENANKYIFYAVDGAKRMQTLINDLLSYSRINTHAKKHEEVDMNEIVKKAKYNLTTAINECHAKVLSDDLPIINAEPTQMLQIMQNLIGNALKFKKDNESPVIKVSYKENSTHYEFCISDNGIGIDKKYHERIFIIFQRLHSRTEYSGTGIGLAICKRIAEKHGGKIWFESTQEEGSNFFFTIAK